MDVFKVWVPLREHLRVQALYGTAIALYWKISERQNSTHLAFVKHQNTKTSLYKLSKNNWVVTLFEIFGSVRKKLQSTVSLDHPVLSKLVLETLAWLKESMDWSKQRMYAGLEIYKFINQLVTAAAYFAITALPEFHNFSSAGTFHLPFYENFATFTFSRCGSLSRYHICGQIVFQV